MRERINEMINKVFQNIVFILASIILIYYLISAIYPFEILKISGEMEVKTPVVEQGGQLVFVRKFEKLIDLPATVDCWFQDELIYNLPTRQSNHITGNILEGVIVDIPKTLPPDIYSYNCDLIYKISPLRSIKYSYQTGKFEVIKQK